MADNFGLKIGVESEKEFKKTLADINQLIVQDTRLGNEADIFAIRQKDKSVQALSARNNVLNKEIEA